MGREKNMRHVSVGQLDQTRNHLLRIAVLWDDGTGGKGVQLEARGRYMSHNLKFIALSYPRTVTSDCKNASSLSSINMSMYDHRSQERRQEWLHQSHT